MEGGRKREGRERGLGLRLRGIREIHIARGDALLCSR